MSGTMLQINFKYSVTDSEYEELASSLAPAFAKVPGLVWKVWTMNPGTREAGGIYHFDSGQALEQFLVSQLATDVRTHPAISEFSAKTFDVMEAATQVTRGPVTELVAP